MTDRRWAHGAREASRFPWGDLIPFAFGALTMVAVSLALATGAAHASPHQVWVGFVPVGAIASGACAASGYYLGALVSGRRPSAIATALMRASSIPFYVATCVLQFQRSAIGEGTARGLLSLDGSINPVIRAISLDPSGLNAGTLTGGLAYPLIILAGLGFAVGTAAVTHLLAAPIHCHKCRKYLRRDADHQVPWTTCEFEAAARTGAFGREPVGLVARHPHAARVDT